MNVAPDSATDGAPDSPVDESTDEPAETAGVDRRRVDKTLVLVIVLLGVGAFMVVRGLLVGITGDERADLPPLIESLEPVPEAVQVLSQSSVFVDLATGYTGVLVIDGVELETVNLDEIGQVDAEPGQQIDLPPVTIYEPGNATLTFTPNAGAAITQFTEGRHSAEVIYWRIEDGRQRARTFSWTFDVV